MDGAMEHCHWYRYANCLLEKREKTECVHTGKIATCLLPDAESFSCCHRLDECCFGFGACVQGEYERNVAFFCTTCGRGYRSTRQLNGKREPAVFMHFVICSGSHDKTRGKQHGPFTQSTLWSGIPAERWMPPFCAPVYFHKTTCKPNRKEILLWIWNNEAVYCHQGFYWLCDSLVWWIFAKTWVMWLVNDVTILPNNIEVSTGRVFLLRTVKAFITWTQL